MKQCSPPWVSLVFVGVLSVAGLIAGWPGSAWADPLHTLGGTKVWRHEFSGWLFPVEVAGMQRVLPPYQLDGGDSAGVRYESADGVVRALEVEILLGAGIPTSTLADGLPFQLEAAPYFKGHRTLVTEAGATVARYQFVHEAWTVRIVATSAAVPGSTEAGLALDAAVNALPWTTLGSADRLH